MSLFSFGGPAARRAIPFDQPMWPGVIIFGLITGVAFYFGGWWTYENYRFEDHARVMEATVLQKYLAKSSGRHGTVYTPHLVYWYQVGNMTVNCEAVVQRDTWDQVVDGGVMPIKYLPEDPSDNRIANTAEDFKLLLKGRMGLVAGVVALVFCVTTGVGGSRRIKLVKKLTTTGLSTVGLVTSVDTERVGKQMQTFFRFEFTDNHGRVIEGRSAPLTARQEGLWVQGKRLTVFYDPADSSCFTMNPNVVMDG